MFFPFDNFIFHTPIAYGDFLFVILNNNDKSKGVDLIDNFSFAPDPRILIPEKA